MFMNVTILICLREDSCSFLFLVHATGSMGHELLRSGAHGLSMGVQNLLSGGDFGSGFAAGAFSSFAGSAMSASGMEAGSLASLGGMSLMGGVASALSGGSFFGGLLSGLNIGVFNHSWRIDDNGMLNCDMDEIVVIGHRQVSLLMALSGIINKISIVSGGAEKTSKYTYKGSNGRYYFQNSKTKRRFYGNQFVKVKPLFSTTYFLSKANGVLNVASNGAEVAAGFVEDGGSFGYNAQRHTVHCMYTTIGSEVGCRIGSWIGRNVAFTCFMGVSGGLLSIPAATVGDIAGGMAGAYLGEEIGNLLYEINY